MQVRDACTLATSLARVSAELDALDDALHDLVMRRADVVARMAASRVKGDASSFRPGREAKILRRLLARHSGPLPPAALARLWREILSASNAMQGGFSVALPEGDAEVYKAARARFGAMAAPDLRAGPEAALAALAEGVARRCGRSKTALPVENTRGRISKRDMVLNDALPRIEVDAETYEVRADGELLVCEPAKVLPMAQRYFLF